MGIRFLGVACYVFLRELVAMTTVFGGKLVATVFLELLWHAMAMFFLEVAMAMVFWELLSCLINLGA